MDADRSVSMSLTGSGEAGGVRQNLIGRLPLAGIDPERDFRDVHVTELLDGPNDLFRRIARSPQNVAPARLMRASPLRNAHSIGNRYCVYYGKFIT